MQTRRIRAQSGVRFARPDDGRALWSNLPLAVVAMIVSGALGASRNGAGTIDPSASPQPTSPTGATTPAGVGSGATAAPAPSSRPPLPGCRYGDEIAAHAGYGEWRRTIVDTMFRLPADYRPPDLVAGAQAGLAGGGSVRNVAIADLRELTRAARNAGARLAVQSAYRSAARQATVFGGWVRVSGIVGARRFSARPGHSEHQLGTAIDFRAARGGPPWNGDFASTPQGKWLAANAWRFGWIMSYPAGAQADTCYSGEPWHFRYLGRPIAAEVHHSGLSLRAWLWRSSGQ